jgi:hypothetical protein
LIGINIVIVVCAGANVSVLIGRNIRVVIRVGINIRIVCHCVVGGIQAFAKFCSSGLKVVYFFAR